MTELLRQSARDRDRASLLPGQSLEATNRKVRQTPASTTTTVVGGGTGVAAELGTVVSYDVSAKLASVSLASGTELVTNLSGFGLTAGDSVAVVRNEAGAGFVVGMSRLNTSNPPPFEQVVLEAQFPLDTGFTVGLNSIAWGAFDLSSWGAYDNSAVFIHSSNTPAFRVLDLDNVSNFTDVTVSFGIGDQYEFVGGQLVYLTRGSFGVGSVRRFPSVSDAAVTVANSAALFADDSQLVTVEPSGRVRVFDPADWSYTEPVSSGGLGSNTYLVAGSAYAWNWNASSMRVFGYSGSSWFAITGVSTPANHVGTAVADNGSLLSFRNADMTIYYPNGTVQTFSQVWDSVTYGNLTPTDAAVLSDSELLVAGSYNDGSGAVPCIAAISTTGSRIVWQDTSGSPYSPAGLTLSADKTVVRWGLGSVIFQGALL